MPNNNARREATALVFLVFLLGVIFGGVGDHLWRVRAASQQPINTKPTRDQVMNGLTQQLQLTADQQKQHWRVDRRHPREVAGPLCAS